LGKQVELTVADQGMGIKASDIPHIFERFYRADPSRTKEKIAGYGLGLSLAKQVVQMHKGSISVQSTPGEGTIFTIHLPHNDHLADS
jgi:signal transduction histidine kinase